MQLTQYDEFDRCMTQHGLPDYELLIEHGSPVLTVYSEKWGLTIGFALTSTNVLRDAPATLADSIAEEIKLTGMKGAMRGHNS